MRESPLLRNLQLEHRAKILGTLLVCLAFSAQALNLGRLQGAALIGHALDVAVEIQLDPGDDATALCLDAEVFQADTRQDPSRVRVQLESATAGVARVRVLSSSLIEEPVVSFNLHIGCGQKTSRRYVLLADLPGEVAAVPVPLLTSVVPVSATPAKSELSGNDVPTASPAAKPLAQAPAPVAREKAKTKQAAKARPSGKRGARAKGTKARRAATAAKRSAAPVPAKPASSAGSPRLKLDPLETLADRVASLAPLPAASEPVPEAQINSQKVQELQGDVKALRDAAAKTEASLADMKSRLQKAESERYSSSVVLGLLGLLLLSLLAAALLWIRQRRGLPGEQEWWGKAAPVGHAAVTKQGPSARAEPTVPAEAPVPQVEPQKASQSSEPLVDRAPAPDSVFSDLMQQDGSNASGAAMLTRTPRQLAADPILKLRRQARELSAAGKADAAVQLLRQQIRDSREPNPLLYLDLLGLYHALVLPTEFQQLAQDMKLLFNLEIPGFDFFRDQGRSLESYPDMLAAISALWPKPEVQLAIEACIFRDPWAEKNHPVDLAAFYDLLLLHSIAQSATPAAAMTADIDLTQLLPQRR